LVARGKCAQPRWFRSPADGRGATRQKTAVTAAAPGAGRTAEYSRSLHNQTYSLTSHDTCFKRI
jgi:hypothetical protein